MTTMRRYRYVLTGFEGAPGYTSFYTDDVVVDTGFFNAFWGAVVPLFPNGTTLTQPDFADEMTVETGEITGEVAVVSQPPIVSPQPAGAYAGMAGAFIDWSCSPARVHGRTVRGRTFLVPLIPGAFSNNGLLLASTQTSILAAVNSLLGSTTGHLSIWARPYAGRGIVVRPGKPDLPAIPARVGTLWPISAGSVPLMQATLRSRRS